MGIWMKVNSREYLNDLYSDPNWKLGYGDAYKRLDQVVSRLGKYQRHLDIGCANGYFTEKYLETYPYTDGYGIDLSDEVISQIPFNIPATFLQGNIYELLFKDGFFDLIHCGELLEHLEEPERAIKEMARVLRKGGILVITTPNNEATPYEEHVQTWDIEDVKKLLKDFEVVSEDPAFFNDHLMYLEARKR